MAAASLHAAVCLRAATRFACLMGADGARSVALSRSAKHATFECSSRSPRARLALAAVIGRANCHTNAPLAVGGGRCLRSRRRAQPPNLAHFARAIRSAREGDRRRHVSRIDTSSRVDGGGCQQIERKQRARERRSPRAAVAESRLLSAARSAEWRRRWSTGAAAVDKRHEATAFDGHSHFDPRASRSK